MTPEEIAQLFYTFVDDQPDEDATYALMDTAYTQINEERVWAMLMKLDTSITHSPGNSWQTEKTLPSDFNSAHKLFGGDSGNEYDPIPFDTLLHWKDNGNMFAVDLANMKMRLTGSPSTALTMYLWYQYTPTSLMGLSVAQKASASTIVWPARFRPILAYKMAEILFGAVDADDVTRKQTPYQRAVYKELKKAMVNWNTRNILKMMGSSVSQNRSTRDQDRPDVLDW